MTFVRNDSASINLDSSFPIGGITLKKTGKLFAAALLAVSVAASSNAFAASSAADAKSPIKHTVVIYQENRSFDNYFGTYPSAPGFHALPGTPAVNGIPAGSYNLDENGNKVSPYLFGSSELRTEDVNHHYADMISAYDNGLMDKFYQASENHKKGTGKIAMGYYDYHALPAYWQYAQHFALADNWFQPVFGPSTPGALYLVAAQSGNKEKPITGDPVPAYGPLGGDDWGANNRWEGLHYKNIGDELSANNVSWSWYQDGYNDGNSADKTYSPHHNPFQYFDNYQKGVYQNNIKDYSQLAKAVDSHSLPSVVFVKAGYGDDEHPGTGNQSTPAAEDFSVKTINKIMNSSYWKDTAIIITYDESGGYWDHVAAPQVTPSPDGMQGNGPRIPALVISPYAKRNYVSHIQYDTTSILKFIEWNYGVSALNNRDANASNLLDFFDFNHPDFTPYLYTDGGDSSVKVKINNAELTNSIAQPFVGKNQEVMIPLVDFARDINANISYDSKTAQINLVYNGSLIQISLHNGKMSINGEQTKMPAKLWTKNGHAYISAESLGNMGMFTVSSKDGVVITTN